MNINSADGERKPTCKYVQWISNKQVGNAVRATNYRATKLIKRNSTDFLFMNILHTQAKTNGSTEFTTFFFFDEIYKLNVNCCEEKKIVNINIDFTNAGDCQKKKSNNPFVENILASTRKIRNRCFLIEQRIKIK